MNKIEAKPKFPNAWKYGLTLSLLILGLTSVVNFFKSCSLERKGETRAAVAKLPICQAKKAELSRKDDLAKQVQNWNCLSGLIVLPSDLEMGSLRYSFPGTTEIYECKRENGF